MHGTTNIRREGYLTCHNTHRLKRGTKSALEIGIILAMIMMTIRISDKCYMYRFNFLLSRFPE